MTEIEIRVSPHTPTDARTRAADGGGSVSTRARIACIPPALPANPYLHLLYGELAKRGLVQVADARLELGWLLRSRRRVDAIHLHWPDGLYRHAGGPQTLRGPLSWAKLALFTVRLLAARIVGYRIVWTVHQARPHETESRLRDAVAALVLGHLAHALVVHERATVGRASELLRLPERRFSVIPHGCYVGVYPPGRPRAETRAALGVPDATFVFLCFGELRAYKGIDLLLEAFRSLDRSAGCVLLVAGNPKDRALASRVEAAGMTDPRIIPLLRFIDDAEVGELFAAADAAVLPRGDGGTSGSLLLALSQGAPVVAAAAPGVLEVLDGAEAGWLFRPDDCDSLRSALEAARRDVLDARARGRAALTVAHRLAWPDIAARTASLLAPESPP